MIVYVVEYSPGEPYGTYTICICATEHRAECEKIRLVLEERYNEDHLFVEEIEVLE